MVQKNVCTNFFSWFRRMYALTILMVQKDVCTNFFSILTQEYKVVRIKEKIAQILRCSDFKSGASKV